MSQYAPTDTHRPARTADDDTTATKINFGIDRVRWGPIIAGLFVALSTLTVLGVLGLAIGFSSVDADDSARGFGIGAGIWGAISALIAFAAGGFIAARNAATPVVDVTRQGNLHPSNGLLQGAMVWAVAIPLSTYFVASMAGGAVNTAGSMASTGLQTTATMGQNAVGRPTAADRVADANTGREAVDAAKQEATAATQKAGDAAQAVGEQLQGATQSVQNAMTGQNVEKAAGYGARAGWGLLVSMLLGLGAAVTGGVVGGKSRPAGAAI